RESSRKETYMLFRIDQNARKIIFYEKRAGKKKHVFTANVIAFLGKGAYGQTFLVELGKGIRVVIKIQHLMVIHNEELVLFRWDREDHAYFTAGSCLEAMALMLLEHHNQPNGTNDTDKNITTPRLIANFFATDAASSSTKQQFTGPSARQQRMITMMEVFDGYTTFANWRKSSDLDPLDICIVRERIRKFERRLRHSPMSFMHNDLHEENILVCPSTDPATAPIVIIDFGMCSFYVRPADACRIHSAIVSARHWQGRCYGGGVLFRDWQSVDEKVGNLNPGPPCTQKDFKAARSCSKSVCSGLSFLS
ncbi:MAG TPA: phosphotransferase, partial [Gammaproteobacteria bacterium]|nr:phosphotransferase [Gammaproteobacteria bacterium]